MRKKLKDQLPLLIFFEKNANTQQQKAIIKHLNEIQLKTISELALNLIKGNIPLTANDKLFLKRYAKLLRKLADHDITYTKKKTIITRKVLLALAKFVLPLLL